MLPRLIQIVLRYISIECWEQILYNPHCYFVNGFCIIFDDKLPKFGFVTITARGVGWQWMSTILWKEGKRAAYSQDLSMEANRIRRIASSCWNGQPRHALPAGSSFQALYERRPSNAFSRGLVKNYMSGERNASGSHDPDLCFGSTHATSMNHPPIGRYGTLTNFRACSAPRDLALTVNMLQ